MRNTKRISKTPPKHPNEEQDNIAHTPIDDTQVNGTPDVDAKIDEADIRTFTSNSDAFDAWEDESEDIYQDYFK